jgi:hypothetical protein
MKPECPKKITDLSQFTDILDRNIKLEVIFLKKKAEHDPALLPNLQKRQSCNPECYITSILIYIPKMSVILRLH